MAIRNTLSTNKQLIYLCKKNSDNTWAEPQMLRLNIMQVTNQSEIVAFGARFPENLVCICTKDISKQFANGDRIYFNKQLPKNHNELQNKKEDANYTVTELPTNSLNTSEIRFTYLEGR